MAPDFGPARFAIAVEALTIGIGRRLVIPLDEEDLGNPVVGQRTVLVDVEGFVELRKRARQIALLSQPLSALRWKLSA